MAISEHEHREDLIKPGNEEYLSYYLKQNEWEPTKPIGAIGAMSSSPGPAIVMLKTTVGDQDHCRTKTKAPSYKIGEKESSVAVTIGPGPAKYNVRQLTNKGKDVCHAPVVGERIEGYVAFRAPGPGVYHRGNSDRFAYRRSPAYSMRPKTEPLKGFIPPAPSSYTLPDTLGPGKSPYQKREAFTIGERLDKTGTLQPNPGPAAYELPRPCVTRPRAPAFSMRMKEDSSKIGITSQGPASNEYHLVKFHKPATPRYSFGIRHTPYKAFQHFAAEK